MRISMLAIAATLSLATAPALAQVRILTVQAQAEAQAPASPEAVPSAPAPATEPAPTVKSTQDKAPAAPPSRFTFNRVDDGFLRLDNETGHIAFCRPHTAGWACQGVPEDRAALEQEIARLRDEVASLKQEIAARREPPSPPPRPPAELTPPAAGDKKDDKGGDITLKLPTQEDIDHARAALSDAWRRLVDMLVSFKNDMMRKG